MTENKAPTVDRQFRNFLIFLVLGSALMTPAWLAIGLELTANQTLAANLAATVGFVVVIIAVWKLVSPSENNRNSSQ